MAILLLPRFRGAALAVWRRNTLVWRKLMLPSIFINHFGFSQATSRALGGTSVLIGGGVALVPGLILLFGFTQQEAQGTSLAVLIPPIGLFAAIPAVVAYNRYSHDIERLAIRFESFMEEFSNILHRQATR